MEERSKDARGGAGIAMTAEQRLHWLRLARTDGIGPSTFRALINRFGTAAAALDALPDLAARAGRRRVRIPDSDAIRREADALQRFGGQLVCSNEPDYPPAMRLFDAAPMVLSVVGDPAILRRPTIGMVGSRDASVSSVKLARQFAAALGEGGFAVVSGLARGIDAAAHEGSLATGTVACLAGGVNRIYPSENEPLARRIAEGGGALVTEMPFGWQPRAKDFPRRNRIIAGIGLGLLVVDAARRSGSLITARIANEIGREVFAVPGSPLDPRAAGANGLIRDGATFTTEPADVLDALAPLVETTAKAPHAPVLEETAPVAMAAAADGSERALVEGSLDRTPVTVDELVRHTALPLHAVQLALLELDLGGDLVRHGDGRVSLG